MTTPAYAPGTSVVEVDGQPIEYRRAGTSPRVVLILPGGHMSAACTFDEETYRASGASVLVVSRPGYGRTAVAAGPSAPEFAVRLAGLCRDLGIDEVTVVGISLGARTALTLASYAPDLVRDVILLCPTSFAPWPAPRKRALARVVFNPATERLTWGSVHTLLRRDPQRYLPRLLGDLSVRPGPEVVTRLGPDRQHAIDFLLGCRSGSGFMIDLRPPTDVTAQVAQPVLVLATRLDGSVEFAHPQRLVDTLPDARLVEVPTVSHLLWLGAGSEETKQAIRRFLA